MRHMSQARHPPDHLTRREREIVNAIFALSNRASAEDIRGRLSNPPSDSSVRVMLARLERTGLIVSRRQRWLGLFEQFPGLSKWSLCRGLGRRE